MPGRNDCEIFLDAKIDQPVFLFFFSQSLFPNDCDSCRIRQVKHIIGASVFRFFFVIFDKQTHATEKKSDQYFVRKKINRDRKQYCAPRTATRAALIGILIFLAHTKVTAEPIQRCTLYYYYYVLVLLLY